MKSISPKVIINTLGVIFNTFGLISFPPRWENFVVALGRAIESCKSLKINVDDHFRELTKMIPTAKGAHRPIQDFMLTRYACYLIAQNGDPKKEEIAFAQSYFAVQTRDSRRDR